MEEKLIVDDIYEILMAIISSSDGRAAVAVMQTVTALCRAAVKMCYGAYNSRAIRFESLLARAN